MKPRHFFVKLKASAITITEFFDFQLTQKTDIVIKTFKIPEEFLKNSHNSSI